MRLTIGGGILTSPVVRVRVSMPDHMTDCQLMGSGNRWTNLLAPMGPRPILFAVSL
jgi:hypothetical protein